MTVASTTNRKTFTGDSVTTSFGTSPVVFFDSADLTIFVVNTTTGAATTLTENTDYTVSGGAGSTGTVSLAGGSAPWGALATGTTLVILRELDLVQSADFVQNDGSDAGVTEDALDKLTMMAQQLSTRIDRSFTLADSDVSGVSLAIPTVENRANKFIVFDADGAPIVSDGTGADTGLRGDLANTATASLGASLLGWIRGLTSAVATNIKKLLGWNKVNVFEFMTAAQVADVQAGTLTLDVAAALQAAFDTGYPVYLPPGKYKTASSLVLSDDAHMGQHIQGAGCVRQDLGTGTNKTVIVPTSAVSVAINMTGSGTSVRGAELSDFSIDMANMTDASTRIGIKQNTAFENKHRNITFVNQGSNKRMFKFETGAYLTIIENCRGTIIELAGNSLGDAVTTLTFLNCDVDSYIMNNASGISVYGGAVQGALDKFDLQSNVEGLTLVGVDIEGTGTFLKCGTGIKGISNPGCYFGGFSGTFRSGTFATQKGLYYEVGTWTPVLLINASATGITGTLSGAFTRIGDMVFGILDGVLTSKGASVGAVTMTGLPFTADANYNQDFPVNLQNSSYTGDPTGRIGPSATSITFQVTNAGSQGNLTNTNLTDTSVIRATFFYKCV